MLDHENAADDFWCPAEDTKRRSGRPDLEMTPADWAALSRFATGDWVSDALIGRLESLGLVEKVFGQALLTRLGRTTLGAAG